MGKLYNEHFFVIDKYGHRIDVSFPPLAGQTVGSSNIGIAKSNIERALLSGGLKLDPVRVVHVGADRTARVLDGDPVLNSSWNTPDGDIRLDTKSDGYRYMALVHKRNEALREQGKEIPASIWSADLRDLLPKSALPKPLLKVRGCLEVSC